MKQKILELLKTKFNGVQDAILSRIADKLAKTATTEEAATTAVEGVTFQQVLESYGDSRATEATDTAVKNYEKKHNLKDGKKVEETKPETETKPNEDVPAWAIALQNSVKALADRQDANDKATLATARKAQLSKVLEKLPENLRKVYERIGFDSLSDEDFKTQLEEITTEVDDIASSMKQRGVVFKPAGSGQDTTKNQISDDVAKSVVDKIGI